MEESSEIKRDLYNSVKYQNEMIDVEHAKLRDIYSTDNQRIKNMQLNIQTWNYFNYLLWMLYYIFILVIIYFYVNKETINLTTKTKTYIVIGLILYPFLITSIELIFYNFLQFLKSVFFGLPYPKYEENQPTFSFMNGLPSLYY